MPARSPSRRQQLLEVVEGLLELARHVAGVDAPWPTMLAVPESSSAPPAAGAQRVARANEGLRGP